MGRKLQASFKKKCESIKSLQRFAEECSKTYSNQCVYYLVGEVGAGKTEWTKAFCKALGSTETQSPSFSLQNVYELNEGRVRHFDLYRLESEEDIVSSGVWDVLDEDQDIVVIEWANLISLKDIPNHRSIVKLDFQLDRSVHVQVYAAVED